MELLLEKQVLSNGLILEMWDCSRKVATDSVFVRLSGRIRVDVETALSEKGMQSEAAIAAIGEHVFYTHEMERKFIPVEKKDTVMETLLSSFQKDTMAYLSHPDFACRLVAKHCRERGVLV